MLQIVYLLQTITGHVTCPQIKNSLHSIFILLLLEFSIQCYGIRFSGTTLYAMHPSFEFHYEVLNPTVIADLVLLITTHALLEYKSISSSESIKEFLKCP